MIETGKTSGHSAAEKTPKSASKNKSGALKTGTLKAGTAATLVTLSSFGVLKAVAATVTLPIVARFVKAIEITVNTSMDFGTLAMTADRAGKAKIDPVSDKLYIDGNSSLSQAGGVPRAGRVAIKGANLPINVSVESQTVRLTNGTTFLTVDNFTFITENGGAVATITPAENEPTVIAVGARVNTRPGQVTGTYVGSNRISANYQ